MSKPDHPTLASLGWAHTSIYPKINPTVHYDAQTFAGKVVLITGASRGIGAEIALQYARAGATLTLVARTQAALDASRDAILRERPSAQILTFPADVTDVTKAQEAVASTIARFGRLDILVANAAVIRRIDLRALSTHVVLLRFPSWVMPLSAFGSKDAKGWWDVLEVNIRGTYNFIQCESLMTIIAHHLHRLLTSFSVPELLKTKGQVIIVTSGAAQVRIPAASEYCISKFAINRLAEFVTIGEYP
jgi:NAD(P)-dependent dehydrogenase (short-subunit alcohol dehydrogenase family)